MAQVELSDLELNQALKLIAQVPTFDGSPEDLCTFIARIEGILELYPTQDERQARIMYLATDFRLLGEASRVNVMGEAKTWSELKPVLIEAFPINSRFNESLKGFVDDLEYKAFQIRSKVGLDDEDTIAKDVVDQKLSDRYLKSLKRLDISTISILKKASQMREFYERELTKEKYERELAKEKYKDLNNDYDPNDFSDSRRKRNSDKSPESPRLIRRAHRNLTKNTLPLENTDT